MQKLTKCRKCDVKLEQVTRYCPHCGIRSPLINTIWWDYGVTPTFDAINTQLEPYGCRIVYLDSSDDYCEVYVESLKGDGDVGDRQSG